jgi:hypothetical protein
MKKLPLSIPILLGLAATCTRAQFSPIPGRDSSPPEDLVCPAPVKPHNCTPENTPCDPVCQTGCNDWCTQKCSKTIDGTVACMKTGSTKAGDECQIIYRDLPDQYDDCEPGTIGLTPDYGTGRGYCFTFCRTNADCNGGVMCSERLIGSSSSAKVSVCDPLYTKCDDSVSESCCDPINNKGCNIGPRTYCYLTPSLDGSTGDNRTVCEYMPGKIVRGSRCAASRDCEPGYMCYEGFCRKVCKPKDTCPGGATCEPYGNQYGVCP